MISVTKQSGIFSIFDIFFIFQEAKKVIDCINDTKTKDRSECSIYAENVKSCRYFWVSKKGRKYFTA